MSMYDTFGTSGDQLKIFSVPCFYYNEAEASFPEDRRPTFISFTGGLFRYFGIGTEVPWKNMCYKYQKDFVVIDAGWECSEFIVSVKDGKLDATYDSISEIPEDLVTDKTLVLDYYGNPLNINSNQELAEYVDLSHNCENKKLEIVKEYTKKISPLHEAIAKEGGYLSTRDQILALENERSEKIRRLYLPLKKFSKEKDPMERVLETYGAYLELADHHKEDKDEGLKEALRKEARDFLSKNPITLDEFFEWNETTEEVKEKIRRLDKWLRC